jgi:hypothetical protein
MTHARRPAAWILAIALLLCFATGVLAILGAFDLGPIRHADINGPPWIAGVAGALFLLFGTAMLLSGSPRFAGLLRYAGVPALIGSAAITNWIAFGEGPRACSGGFSFLFVSSSGPTPELECRIAFGFGALIIDALLLWGLGALAEKTLGPGRVARVLQKTGRGALLLTLLPLLLVALGLQRLQRLLERLRRDRET